MPIVNDEKQDYRHTAVVVLTKWTANVLTTAAQEAR